MGSKTLENDMSQMYMRVAEGITNTCHEAYNRSATKLAPESFKFIDAVEAKAIKTSDKYYILRPETVESYFTLWRLTKDPKYRQWGWDVVEVSSAHCCGSSRIETHHSEEKHSRNCSSHIAVTMCSASFGLILTIKFGRADQLTKSD